MLGDLLRGPLLRCHCVPGGPEICISARPSGARAGSLLISSHSLSGAKSPRPPTSTATRTGLDSAGALGLGWGAARSKPSREPSGQRGVAGAGSSRLFIPARLGALS